MRGAVEKYLIINELLEHFEWQDIAMTLPIRQEQYKY